MGKLGESGGRGVHDGRYSFLEREGSGDPLLTEVREKDGSSFVCCGRSEKKKSTRGAKKVKAASVYSG